MSQGVICLHNNNRTTPCDEAKTTSCKVRMAANESQISHFLTMQFWQVSSSETQFLLLQKIGKIELLGFGGQLIMLLHVKYMKCLIHKN